MRAFWMAGLVVAAGCTPESSRPAKSEPSVKGIADDRDALWTLAPDGATLGVVASPRGVAMMEHALLAIQDRLASRAELAALHGELLQTLQGAVGSPRVTLASLGLTADRGLAVFMAEGAAQVIILPVGDRDQFIAATHGSKGADGDHILGWFCKAIDARYACARQRERLSTLGRGTLDVVRRESSTRGDLELAWRVAEGLRVVAVAELERGGVIVRGTVGGVSRDVLGRIGSPSRPRNDSETAASFGVFEVTSLLSTMSSRPIAPGVTLKDLARSVSGPITYVLPAGTNDLGLRVPLSDPAPAATIIAHCADLEPVVGRRTLLRGGACEFPFPGYDLTVEGWVDGKELRIGDRAAVPAGPLIPTRLAREVAQGEWSVAIYGRGSYFNQRHAPVPATRQPVDGAQVLQTLLPMLAEVGAAIRKDEGTLQFVGGARSIWSYPDDVAQKLLAISSEDVFSGRALGRCESIVTAAPTSVFAQDFRATPTGMLGVGMAFSFITAAVVPNLIHPQAKPASRNGAKTE